MKIIQGLKGFKLNTQTKWSWLQHKCKLIGVSLIKPHTSVTALHMCVYLSMDWPLPVNFKWVHSNISWRSISWSMWSQWRSDCQSAVSATRSKDDWSWSMRGNLILVCASTDDSRPLTGSTNLIWIVVDWVASSWGYTYTALKRQKLSSRFRCKLSSCMCSHISCPGWRNAGICDTYINLWWGLSYLCVIKFGLNSWQWQILPMYHDKVVN